jgi:endonuclease YncB( thermonuclease family)
MINAGKEASDFTVSQLQLGMSYAYQVVDIDKYGRSVCLIELNRDNNLNLSIVNAGFAVPYKRYIPDNTIKLKYIKALRDAKQNNLGLWKSHPNIMECMEESR